MVFLFSQERLPFDPISEHRAWCPWASEQQLIRMGKSQEETVAKRPGWQQLLEALVQEVSPEKSSISRIVKTVRLFPPRNHGSTENSCKLMT